MQGNFQSLYLEKKLNLMSFNLKKFLKNINKIKPKKKTMKIITQNKKNKKLNFHLLLLFSKK